MITQTAAAIIWFAGLVGWYIIRHPFARKAKRIAITTSLYDQRETFLLAFASFGLVVVPAVYVLTGFPALLDRPFVPAIAWLGIPAQCVALWLFRRSHVDLGRNWSISLEVRDRHVLVKKGVYSRIRHPMYSSFFLLGVAQLLLLPNWLAGLSGLAGALVLYAFRVTREEQMMLELFGDEYRAYMTNTKRLIPWML
jgi:protein-S-isoprenylcysteine O-methyltransferase Ste14